jgi:hypothetical protein
MFIVPIAELPTTRLVVDGETVVSGPTPDLEPPQAAPATIRRKDRRA